MKKFFIAIAVLVMMVLGMGTAQAAQWEPNGEEQVVTLTPPSALHGCARVVADIQNLEDVHVDYNNTQELVATWSVFTDDPKFFIATATLQSQFYSLNNPLNPGRSTEATVWIPRCPNIEHPVTDPAIDDVPLLPPATDAPKAEEVPAEVWTPTVEVPVTTPVVPVQAIVIPEAPVVAEKPVEAPVTASEAPVVVQPQEVVEAPQAAPVAREELAATGMKENVATTGAILLLLGLGFVIISRKLAKKV